MTNGADNDPATVGQVRDVRSHILDREEMAAVMSTAVTAGIRAAVSDPAMWTAAGEAMQKQAANVTGGWILARLKAVFNKILLIALLVIGFYSVGGWPAVATVWKFIGGGSHP